MLTAQIRRQCIKVRRKSQQVVGRTCIKMWQHIINAKLFFNGLFGKKVDFWLLSPTHRILTHRDAGQPIPQSQRVLTSWEWDSTINFSNKLWLRGRASILLLEGHWFKSPLSACQSVLGQDTEPKNCSWCAGQHIAWQQLPSVYKCMYELL